MKSWSLKNRITALSLVPSLFLSTITITIFLSVYFNHLDDSAANNRDFITHKHVQEIIAHWSKETSPNQSILESIGDKIMQQPQVVSVGIYDKNKHLITQRGKTEPYLTESSRYVSNNKAIYPYIYDKKHTQNPVGWLQIHFDTLEVSLKKYIALFYSLTALVLTFILVVVSTNKTSNRFTQPIKDLITALNQIDITKPEIKLSKGGFKEIDNLETCIVSFISQVNKNHEELTSSTKQATEDLQETLETIEIQNAELHLARKEAVKTNKIKSEFLANISHEIRTPLNAILGFTRLLKKTQITSQQKDYINTINNSSNSLLTLINDVLDFSKIESGHLLLENSPVDLEETIEDVMAMLAPLANEKQLEQSHLVYSDVPTQIISDPIRLRQILTNLLGNAIKFTDSGSITIRAMLEEQNKDSNLIRISITDTGIGLKESSQKDLFQAFQQSSSDIHHRTSGTGLGLAICKKLITLMGGDIGIESTPERGSTFWINFRCQTDPFPITKPYQFNSQLQAFVFDECATDKLSTSHTLEKWGIRTSVFNNQEQWLDQLKKASSDDIFIYGFTHKALNSSTLLLNKLRDDSDYSRARIIYCGYDPETLQPLQTLSDSACLINKPLTRNKLYQAISNIKGPQLTRLSPPAPPRGSAKHCLVVDDVAENLKLACILLKELGHTVTPCSNGKDALNLCTETGFDIIFMDIQMPVMNGTEVIKRIRAHCFKNISTPIIALTAHSLAEERRKLLALGATDYLSKPVTQQQLQHMISSRCSQLSETNKKEPLQDSDINQKVFDLDDALTCVAGKHSLAKEFLLGLLGDLDTKQPSLQRSLQQQDFRNLQDQIHKLNGVCCYTGATRLKTSIHSLDHCLKTSTDIKKITTHFNQYLQDVESLQLWASNTDINKLFIHDIGEPLLT